MTSILIKHPGKENITSLHKSCLNISTFVILWTLTFVCSLNLIVTHVRALTVGLLPQCMRLLYQGVLETFLSYSLTIFQLLCKGFRIHSDESSQESLALLSVFKLINLPNHCHKYKQLLVKFFIVISAFRLLNCFPNWDK